jgi:hypothetical protein
MCHNELHNTHDEARTSVVKVNRLVAMVIFNACTVNAYQGKCYTIHSVVKDPWANLKKTGLRQYRRIPIRCMA